MPTDVLLQLQLREGRIPYRSYFCKHSRFSGKFNLVLRCNVVIPHLQQHTRISSLKFRRVGGFPRLDGPICTNRFADKIRATRLILANPFRVPNLNPFFCESRLGGLKIANRRFETIRANRSHVTKTDFLLFYESPRFAFRIAGPSKFHSPGGGGRLSRHDFKGKASRPSCQARLLRVNA